MTDGDLKTYREAMAILSANPDAAGLDGVTVGSCYQNAHDTAREQGFIGIEYENAVCDYFVAAVRLCEIV